ncbi:hypothetical protein JRO89_XS09G0238100 [Xanthoceras sorbifolium]|uniref:Uncharacterized protein n=1 Tax=Xanthoceras sorbifolium TaxID=99658 RepID=A0ABQ8HMR8_9ROSI|nr:hypothetical protein JRO89_XS09G0238100 [Xanthoceras sorbifolium]
MVLIWGLKVGLLEKFYLFLIWIWNGSQAATAIVHMVYGFVSEFLVQLIVLLASRAARLDILDAINAAIINMLGDPMEGHANIKEMHFLPFNPVNKHTAITYIDSDGNWYRGSKGAPELVSLFSKTSNPANSRLHG